MEKKYETKESESQSVDESSAVYAENNTTLEQSLASGIDKGLEDIEKGNVFRAENSADLVKQIFG